MTTDERCRENGWIKSHGQCQTLSWVLPSFVAQDPDRLRRNKPQKAERRRDWQPVPQGSDFLGVLQETLKKVSNEWVEELSNP
jgi:hypothetical protein